MDMLKREKSSESIKTKLEKIKTFCASSGSRVKDSIIANIIALADDLSDKCALLVDVLWRSIKGLESGDDKYIIIEAINILGQSLGLLGFVFPICTPASYVVLLVALFLKVIFHLIDLKKTLEPNGTSSDAIRYELAGLAERLRKTVHVIYIDAVDDEDQVD